MGAHNEDNYAGAAYIFYRNEGGDDNWGEVKKLTASDVASGDYFGYSVSISGDYAIVGAYQENSAAGAAYIFNRNEGGDDSWGETDKIIASDAQATDEFGYSVSISGDYAIVGAYQENSAAGAAYIFNRNEGDADSWGQVTKLTASGDDADVEDYFGNSVSISGDYAIVGAFRDDEKVSNAGAAYIFYRNEGADDNWGQVKKLMASDADEDDFFGWSVSISGDYAIVGAKYEDEGAFNAGAAYIFNRNQGGANNWGQFAKLTASDAEHSDEFGYSVSISGDKAIVGALYEDPSGINAAGAAYIFAGIFHAIPTLPEWGLIIFGSLIAILGVWYVMRK